MGQAGILDYVETCDEICFSFPYVGITLIIGQQNYCREGGKVMGLEERIAMLEEENKQLRDDKETLLLIIDQMRVSLNRLVEHSIKK